MREILFRGKRIDNGEWVYGFFSRINGEPIILSPMDSYKYYRKFFVDVPFKQVIPETVGQYVGIKDKNGKEIYEGDIVNIFFRLDDYEYNYEVGEINLLSDDLWYSDQNEVVGNIHDLDLTEVE